MNGGFKNISELDELSGLVTEWEILTNLRAALRFTLEAEPLLPNAHAWLDRVIFMFDSLKRCIERMFRIEESDGHLNGEHETPALRPRLDKLRSDHEQLRQAIKRLHEQIHAIQSDDPFQLHQLREELRKLLSQTEKHEKDEMRLIRQLFWRDVRSEDG